MDATPPPHKVFFPMISRCYGNRKFHVGLAKNQLLT